jgi:hypothetical protein
MTKLKYIPIIFEIFFIKILLAILLNFLLYLMFSTTYTVLLSPGPEERLANLKQHINKNIRYIANARQNSVQIERKISI